MLPNLLTNANMAQQIHIESGLMISLLEGLRRILGWEAQGDDYTQKLSSLAFVSRSLLRHLERLMTLEETNGYMDVVLETKPYLSKDVDRLWQDHDHFRKATKTIVCRFEQMSNTDHEAFGGACDELADLLHKVDSHSRKEAKLIQDAFEQEVGGEG